MTCESREAAEYAAAAPELAKANPPVIVDVIMLERYDNKFYYVVVDRDLRYLYSRGEGSRFTGKDGPFYDFLAGTGARGQAFGGRVFDIPLDDGTKFHCQGDVWACGQPKGMDTVQIGAASREELNACYVFCSSRVERSVLNAWLATNQPKTEYYSLDPKEPERRAYQEKCAAEAAALREKQANCKHDFEEVEGTVVDDHDDEIPVTFDRCKLCGHETEPVEHDYSEAP